VLQNIILSHHGEPEHGALRPPMTVEAIFVAQLDNLDARVAMALASVDPEGTGRAAGGTAFTERHHGLGTRLYRLDPLPEG
jgi:3'-5' exoribonuclease